MVNLNIITAKLDSAQRDDEQSQKFILQQFRTAYKGKFGSDITAWIEWDQLEISDPVPNKPVGPEPERHCCDDDNCSQCDLGYHERCRKGCTIVRR